MNQAFIVAAKATKIQTPDYETPNNIENLHAWLFEINNIDHNSFGFRKTSLGFKRLQRRRAI